MQLRNLYALAVTAAMMAMPASGAVILEAGAVLAAPGSTTGTIEVDVENTGPASVTIAGFNFEISAASEIDFTGAGFNTSAPYIFFGDSADQIFSQPLNTSTGSSLSANDLSFSGLGDTLLAGETAGLGLVTFDVSSLAPPGIVTVSFNTNSANTDLSDPSGAPIPIDSFVNGTIDVTGSVVPEPSSTAMLLCCTIGLLACRRRLKASALRLVPIAPSRGC